MTPATRGFMLALASLAALAITGCGASNPTSQSPGAAGTSRPSAVAQVSEPAPIAATHVPSPGPSSPRPVSAADPRKSTVGGNVVALVCVVLGSSAAIVPSAGSAVSIELTPGHVFTSTDAEGGFHFAGLHAGTYTIVMAQIPTGFHSVGPVSETLKVDGNSSAAVGFEIETNAAPLPNPPPRYCP